MNYQIQVQTKCSLTRIVRIFFRNKLKHYTSSTQFKVANGNLLNCAAYETVPIWLRDQVNILNFYGLSDYRHYFVLGTEFFDKNGICSKKILII